MRGATQALRTGLVALALLGLIAGVLSVGWLIGMVLGAVFLAWAIGALLWIAARELWDSRKPKKPP